MNTKHFKIASIAAISLAIFNSAFLLRNYQASKKTVVIDIVRVFNEFNLKKELEQRVAIELNDMNSKVDSFKAIHSVMILKKADRFLISKASADVDSAENRLQQSYQFSDKNINEQVWQRLNTLLTDYGKQYHYSLVIGANGMGTVLYNLDELDKTEELIKFINGKYETGR